MASERTEVSRVLNMGSAKVCALVGSFGDGGLNVIYRDFQGNRFNPDNIDLDFCDRTIVKKQKPKGGGYVR
jgi:hypothetical protein